MIPHTKKERMKQNLHQNGLKGIQCFLIQFFYWTKGKTANNIGQDDYLAQPL